MWTPVEAEIGRSYKVAVSDCCVYAEFVSKCTKILWFEDGNDIEGLEFENGVSLSGLAVELEEISE